MTVDWVRPASELAALERHACVPFLSSGSRFDPKGSFGW